MLTMSSAQHDQIVAWCIRALPDEGCGLLLGDVTGRVSEVIGSVNVAHSARVYEIDPQVMLRASRRADAQGIAIIGVFHSHTHTDAYPSPTDVTQAPDPDWHYVLVSLRVVPLVVRSYLIVDGVVNDEAIVVSL